MPQVMFAVVPPTILLPPIAAPVGIDIATEAGWTIRCDWSGLCLVAVKEPSLSYYNTELLLFTCLKHTHVIVTEFKLRNSNPFCGHDSWGIGWLAYFSVPLAQCGLDILSSLTDLAAKLCTVGLYCRCKSCRIYSVVHVWLGCGLFPMRSQGGLSLFCSRSVTQNCSL